MNKILFIIVILAASFQAFGDSAISRVKNKKMVSYVDSDFASKEIKGDKVRICEEPLKISSSRAPEAYVPRENIVGELTAERFVKVEKRGPYGPKSYFNYYHHEYSKTCIEVDRPIASGYSEIGEFGEVRESDLSNVHVAILHEDSNRKVLSTDNLEDMKDLRLKAQSDGSRSLASYSFIHSIIPTRLTWISTRLTTTYPKSTTAPLHRAKCATRYKPPPLKKGGKCHLF